MSEETEQDKAVRLELERQKLAAEVERIKEQVNSGKRLAVIKSHDERIAAINAGDGIISMGDAIAEALPRFEEMAKKTTDYANRLRQWLSKQKPVFCDDHLSVALPIDFDASFSAGYPDDEMVLISGKCPECQRMIKELLVNEKMKGMGIPDKVFHATWDNFERDTDEKEKAFHRARTQSRKGGFLILRGNFGTGKTHLAAAILKEAGSGILITEHDLIGELRQTYTENSGQNSMVDKYRTTKVLVLDELSTEVKGVDIAPLLYRILGYRHDKNLLTVITSNEELKTILTILGGRLADRIRENYTVATFSWTSHRQPKD